MKIPNHWINQIDYEKHLNQTITKTPTKMKNWKTTIAGLIAGIPVAAHALLTAYTTGAFTGESGSQLAIGVGIVLLGAFSKDHNVIGGTIEQGK